MSYWDNITDIYKKWRKQEIANNGMTIEEEHGNDAKYLLESLERRTIEMLLYIEHIKERLDDDADKEDKYRWHDLRKNPDDLPDSNRFVEVRTEDSFPYYFGWYDTASEFDMWFDAAGFSMEPYKWREIEEEVEE